MAKSKGVAHAGKKIGMASGNADENVRQKNDKDNKDQKVAWDEKTYRAKNRNPIHNYDFSRRDLNFEITRGEDGKPKIIPLGSQDVTLYKRYQKLLQDIGFQQYKTGASNQQLTYVELILSGSTEKMQKLAFGDQQVNYERNPERWHNWGVTRTKDIEQWAVDCYNFVCEKYGTENIVGFEIHLDETEPHAHVNIVPTAIMQQRGRAGGYIKIDKDGNDMRYTKGKHVGELVMINKAKYDRLSDEKKKEYRQNVRGTVRTISYATHFGSTKRERSERMSQLHTDFYEKVGKRYGFERGDVWADLSDEERRRRRHRTKEEAYLEKEAQAAKEKAEQEARTAEGKRNIIVNEVAAQETAKVANAEVLKTQKEEIQKAGAELQQIKNDTVKTKEEAAAAVVLTQKAKAERDTAVKERDDSKAEIERNENTINTQVTAINQNKATLADQEKTKAELEKRIDLMGRIENITYRGVDSYVKDLKGVQIVLNKDIRSKLISPLKNHPRIEYTNPPLTAEELERIALEEESKVINKIGGIIGISKNKANEEIRAIRTDVQTIYFSVVSANQRKGIEDANRNIHKNVRRELAEMYKKAEQYDKLEKAGVSLTSYEDMKEKAKKAENTSKQLTETEQMLEFAWPGVTKAKNILTDPALDSSFMSEEQKKSVLDTLRDNPEHPEDRIADIMKLLKYACSFRDIPMGTRAEAIELAVSSIIKAIAESGYDLIKEAMSYAESFAKDLEMTVAEAAESTASAAACLIYGYLDAATTVSQGCGGGGGNNNELPKKKDDEDMRSFYGRCLNAAAGLMRPKSKKIQQSTGGVHR